MKPITINEFKGLFNTGDEESFPVGAMVQANNIMVNNYGDVIARPGTAKIVSTTRLVASYGTSDNSAIYIIDNGSLYRMDGSLTQMATGFSNAPYQWAEESSRKVFVIGAEEFLEINDFNRIVDLNIPKPEGVTAYSGSGTLPAGSLLVAVQFINEYGIAGALSDAIQINLGDNSSAMVNIPNPNGLIANVVASLPNDAGWVSIGQTYSFLTINSLDVMGEPIDSVYMHTMPAPLDNCLGAEFFRGRLVLANEIPEGTMIRFSKPGFYHLFSTLKDYFVLPDRVTDIANIGGQLLITGKQGIYVYTTENQLVKLADYGCPIGKPILRMPDGGAYLWTDRGVCKYPEFTNLTRERVSVAAGTAGATFLYEHRGSSYLVCSHDGGGKAFNKD